MCDTLEDLRCLRCDYDLRGHSGDPLRCPECGTPNTRADLHIAASFTDADLSRFETPCTVSIVWLAGLLVGGVLAIRGAVPCAITMLLPSAVFWPISVYRFGASHRFRPGWLEVLGWFYLSVASLVLIASLAYYIVDRGASGLVVMAGFAIVTWLCKRPGMAPYNPYMIARKKLRTLCKASAVDRLRTPPA